MLALQDEFADAVAHEIRLKVPSTAAPAAREPKKVEPAAHEASLYLLERETLPALKQSFHPSTRRRRSIPNLRELFAALAHWYLHRQPFTISRSSGRGLRAAKAAAETAIHLSPSLAAAHARAGRRCWSSGDLPKQSVGSGRRWPSGCNDAWSMFVFGRYLMWWGERRSARGHGVGRAAAVLLVQAPWRESRRRCTQPCPVRCGSSSRLTRRSSRQADLPRVLCQQVYAFAFRPAGGRDRLHQAGDEEPGRHRAHVPHRGANLYECTVGSPQHC